MKIIWIITSLFFINKVAWAQEEVRMTYFHVPPHVFYDTTTKRVSGAVFDLITYLADEWDVKVVWDAEPSNIIRERKQLQTGERDAAALFIYNSSDSDRYTYSEDAYYYAKNAIVVKDGNPLKKLTEIDDIVNLRIGYAPKAYISEFMRDKRIKWEYVYATNVKELNLRKLLAGRIDAVYAPDHTAFIFEMKFAKAQKKLRILYTPEPPVPFHIGFSYKKPIIKQKYDAAFKKMNGAKKYAEFLFTYTGGSD